MNALSYFDVSLRLSPIKLPDRRTKTKTIGSMSERRFGVCNSCKKEAAKYRCPRCRIVSCSVACIKEHKKTDPSCDGIRSRSSLVALKKFGYLDLVSGKLAGPKLPNLIILALLADALDWICSCLSLEK